MSSGYQEPSDLFKRLFLPPKNPSLTLSSNQEWMVICQEPPLPSIELLARSEEKLAGLRFDPQLWTPSRMDFATSLVLQHLESGKQQTMALPANSEGIRYIRFHPEHPLFVFASKVKGQPMLELYKCQMKESTNEWSIYPIPLQAETKRMNFIYGCSYQFTSDGASLLVKVLPKDWPKDPPVKPTSTGPAIQMVAKNARKAPSRTYQDLLKNPHDEAKFQYYFTTQLLCIDNITSLDATVPPTARLLPQCGEKGCIFRSIQSSPCGRFLLVQLTTDLSYSVPLSRFGKKIELWDLQSSQKVTVQSLPVDDEIPLSYDACSRHPRSFFFHPCKDCTLIFAQALDGGDPQNNDLANGERDALYLQNIELDSEEKIALKEASKWVGMQWRFSDVEFGASGIAFLDEYRWKDRMERKWILPAPTGDDAATTNKLLWERSWEDRYKSPGAPLTDRGARNQYFVVQPTPTSLYLRGAGASPSGDRPFLDLLEFEENSGTAATEEATATPVTKTTTRLWRCKAPVEGDLTEAASEVGGVLPSDSERQDVFESFVSLLPDNESILISRESKITPRNYYLSKLPTKEDKESKEIQITTFEHPQPDLLGVTKDLVHYKRKDGVDLTANLYLPPNYDGTKRPTLFWAYPREFKDSKAAGQVKGSKHKFVSASWASPIHWAAKGWAIMDDFSLPIIGEGDAQPNDTFIEQLVSGATAAVEFAKERGVCDPDRCAVGGHSYGAFMTSHLLSHTTLFAAGIARSGAYNRTLTPMSFQSEDRSIWEAPDTYITMTPLMHVKKYSEQEKVGKMLLIHGEVDENSGTHPMQSERYFAALKAFGIESKLVMLPHERHSYRAKESILHMAWEQEQWLSSLEATNEEK